MARLVTPAAGSLGGQRNRADGVYGTLRDRIRTQAFAPGSRIVEDELAAELGVSRTPVREALHRLAARGLVENVGRGFEVARLDRKKTVDLYAMRQIVEGAAARLAAQHATAAEIVLLRGVNDAFASAVGDVARLTASNRLFHQTINEASHNVFLIGAANDLLDVLSLLPGTTLTADGRVGLAHAEHRAMIAAIERRDGDEAETLARRHCEIAQGIRLASMFA